MDVSKFISKTMGTYLLLTSLVMLLTRDQFLHSLTLLINDEPLMLVVGFFTLILGIIMIFSHNIWRWNWQGAVTFLAWLIFLKGVCLLFFPQIIYGMSTVFVQNMIYVYTAAGLDLIIGLLLCYFGFKGKNP